MASSRSSCIDRTGMRLASCDDGRGGDADVTPTWCEGAHPILARPRLALHDMKLRDMTCHSIALHCIALHLGYMTRQYITLHCPILARLVIFSPTRLVISRHACDGQQKRRT